MNIRIQDTAPPTIPNTVMGLMIEGGLSPIKAWRKHLRLTQMEVAERMGISRAALSQMETPEGFAKMRRSTLERVAQALGVAYELLEE